MCSRSFPNPLIFAGLVSVLVLLAGCGSGTSALPMEDAENLDAVLRAYFEAVVTLKQPPKSRAELQPFLEKLGDPAVLELSPRDQQPYIIVWGVDPRSIDSPDPANPRPTLVAYESQGKGGERYIATSFGVARVAEVDFHRDYASSLRKEISP